MQSPHVCTNIYTCTATQACAHVLAHTSAHVFTCVHTHTCTPCLCLFKCLYTFPYTYLCTCWYMCLYTCLYAHLYMSCICSARLVASKIRYTSSSVRTSSRRPDLKQYPPSALVRCHFLGQHTSIVMAGSCDYGLCTYGLHSHGVYSPDLYSDCLAYIMAYHSCGQL